MVDCVPGLLHIEKMIMDFPEMLWAFVGGILALDYQLHPMTGFKYIGSLPNFHSVLVYPPRFYGEASCVRVERLIRFRLSPIKFSMARL